MRVISNLMSSTVNNNSNSPTKNGRLSTTTSPLSTTSNMGFAITSNMATNNSTSTTSSNTNNNVSKNSSNNSTAPNTFKVRAQSSSSSTSPTSKLKAPIAQLNAELNIGKNSVTTSSSRGEYSNGWSPYSLSSTRKSTSTVGSILQPISSASTTPCFTQSEPFSSFPTSYFPSGDKITNNTSGDAPLQGESLSKKNSVKRSSTNSNTNTTPLLQVKGQFEFAGKSPTLIKKFDINSKESSGGATTTSTTAAKDKKILTTMNSDKKNNKSIPSVSRQTSVNKGASSPTKNTKAIQEVSNTIDITEPKINRKDQEPNEEYKTDNSKESNEQNEIDDIDFILEEPMFNRFNRIDINADCINPNTIIEFERSPIASKSLSQLSDLNWSVFNFIDESDGHPLAMLSYHIIVKRYDLLSQLKIPVDKFVKYMLVVEKGYDSNLKFHNSIHATDVMHFTYYLTLHTPIQILFKDRPLQLFSLLFAAALHDFDHPGVNNLFIQTTNHPLTQFYSASFLENHHIQSAFLLFDRYNMIDFSKDMDTETFTHFNSLVKGLILSTDLAQHNYYLKKFNDKVKSSGFHPESNQEDLDLLGQILIKCADVSNPVKDWSLYAQWIDRIIQEFYDQGDIEKQIGVNISPFYSRPTNSAYKPSMEMAKAIQATCTLIKKSKASSNTILSSRRPSAIVIEGRQPQVFTLEETNDMTKEEQSLIMKCQKGFTDFIVAPLFTSLLDWTNIEEVRDGLEKTKIRWQQNK